MHGCAKGEGAWEEEGGKEIAKMPRAEGAEPDQRRHAEQALSGYSARDAAPRTARA